MTKTTEVSIDHKTALAISMVFVFVSFFCLRISTIPLGHNDASRWNAIYSLVHHGTYATTDAPWPDSVDQFKIETAEGTSTYSSKPAIIATLAAPFYFLANSLGWTLGKSTDDTRNAISFVLFFINIIPMGLLIYFYIKMLIASAYSEKTKIYCVITAAFGTYLTGYLFTLNNHLPAAASAFFAIYFLDKILFKQSSELKTILACGFFLGLVNCFEFSALVFEAAVLSTLLVFGRWKIAINIALVSLIPIAIFLGCEYAANGSIIPVQLMGLFKGNSAHSRSQDWQKLNALLPIHSVVEAWYIRLFHTTLGHHGLFSLTPIFILAITSMIQSTSAKTTSVLRIFACHCLALITICISVYIYRTRGYGGVCQGYRWLIWLTPIWLFFLPKFIEKYQTKKVFPYLFFPLLAVSIYSALTSTLNPWSTSWLHTAMQSLKIVNY